MSHINHDTAPRSLGGYALFEPIGKGGMGQVYAARAPTGEKVAVKVMAPDIAQSDTQRQRFYQEARMAIAIDHPNIVKGIAVGEDQGLHYFVMEFIAGESLGKVIRRAGRLDEPTAKHYAAELADAVHRAHKAGLIHRDIKPDNAIVTPEGEIKLIDLGLAKQLDTELDLTKTGRGLGTPHFMAPEQFRNAKHADARCDIYSLGATLYMMVTGELPFRGVNPMEAFIKKSKNAYTPPEHLVPRLDPYLAQVIRLSMDANPRRRPGSAKAFKKLLLGEIAADVACRALSPLERRPDTEPKERIWYCIYAGSSGRKEKVRGTESQILRLIDQGRIGPDAMVSPQRDGGFFPAIEEGVFRAAFVEASTVRGVYPAAALIHESATVPALADTQLAEPAKPPAPEGGVVAVPPAADSGADSRTAPPSDPLENVAFGIPFPDTNELPAARRLAATNPSGIIGGMMVLRRPVLGIPALSWLALFAVLIVAGLIGLLVR